MITKIYAKILNVVKQSSLAELKILGLFASSNFLSAIISGISGLFYSQWIGPSDLGEFSKYGILTGYLGIGLIVVHGALPRQYPYLLGKGNVEEAKLIASAAKWWYLMFTWVGTLIFFSLSVKSFFDKDYRAVLGWIVQIPAVWMAIYGLYLQAMYRSSSDFVKLSNSQLIASISSFLMLILVKVFSYWGFLIRYSLQSIINLFVLERYNPSPVKARFDFIRLKELAKMSLPLSIPAYIDTYLLNSSINFFILMHLGEDRLGIYAWSSMLQGMGMIFTKAIHQIYVTKITVRYGQTNDVRNCVKYSFKAAFFSVIIAITLSLIFYYSIGPFIKFIAPRYIDAIPVLQISIWQMPLFASGLGIVMMTTALYHRLSISLRLFKTASCIAFIYFFHSDLLSILYAILISDLLYYMLGYIGLILKIQNKNET